MEAGIPSVYLLEVWRQSMIMITSCERKSGGVDQIAKNLQMIQDVNFLRKQCQIFLALLDGSRKVNHVISGVAV